VAVTSLSLAAALLAGIGIGLWYFGGLWFTVHRLPATRHRVLLLLGSFVTRALTSVWGFHVVMQGSGARLLAIFIGFFAVRTLLVGRVTSERTPSSLPRRPFACMRS
jgi:F1F0 ATPase subunit 2